MLPLRVGTVAENGNSVCSGGSDFQHDGRRSAPVPTNLSVIRENEKAAHDAAFSFWFLPGRFRQSFENLACHGIRRWKRAESQSEATEIRSRKALSRVGFFCRMSLTGIRFEGLLTL